MKVIGFLTFLYLHYVTYDISSFRTTLVLFAIFSLYVTFVLSSNFSVFEYVLWCQNTVLYKDHYSSPFSLFSCCLCYYDFRLKRSLLY